MRTGECLTKASKLLLPLVLKGALLVGIHRAFPGCLENKGMVTALVILSYSIEYLNI